MQLMRRTGHIRMSDEARLARMSSIGGSDARIIMSGDQEAIEKLWREKRGESTPDDLSDIILVQLGNITEALNADLFEREKGLYVTNEQDKVFHPDWELAHATLDGLVREQLESDPIAMVEFKFMFPFGFDKQKAFDKYYAQCQHNMACTRQPTSFLSILTGAAQHVIIDVEADIFYQMELLEAEKDFWDCVQTGRVPGNPVIEVPLVERIKVTDMSTNNRWMSQVQTLISTKTYFDIHGDALKEIKKLMPGDAQKAFGGGFEINLSKDGKKLVKLDAEAVAKFDKENDIKRPEADNDNEKKPVRKRASKKADAAAAA
jgi:predicted phage-related endonuclease